MFELALKSAVGFIATVVVITVFTTKEVVSNSLQAVPTNDHTTNGFGLPVNFTSPQPDWRDEEIRKLQVDIAKQDHLRQLEIDQLETSQALITDQLRELQKMYQDSVRILQFTRQEINRLTGQSQHLSTQLTTTQTERDELSTSLIQCKAHLDEAKIIADLTQKITRKYRTWLYLLISINLTGIIVFLLQRRGWLQFRASSLR